MPAWRERDHREGVRLPDGGEPGAVDRVDGDIRAGAVAVADPLAVEQHRRFVLLSLADHHDAVHRHGVDHQPHRVDRCLVGGVLVAMADPSAGGERRRLGDAHQLHREVPVGSLGHPRSSHRWVTAGTFDASASYAAGFGTIPRARYHASTRSRVSSSDR